MAFGGVVDQEAGTGHADRQQGPVEEAPAAVLAAAAAAGAAVVLVQAQVVPGEQHAVGAGQGGAAAVAVDLEQRRHVHAAVEAGALADAAAVVQAQAVVQRRLGLADVVAAAEGIAEVSAGFRTLAELVLVLLLLDRRVRPGRPHGTGRDDGNQSLVHPFLPALACYVVAPCSPGTSLWHYTGGRARLTSPARGRSREA